MTEKGPLCPECGGKIAETSTYCMHCSADLTEEWDATPVSDDNAWGETARSSDTSVEGTIDASADDATGASAGGASTASAGETIGASADEATTTATASEEESVATQQDLPPEFRSSSGGPEMQLLPDDFLGKAGSFVLALVVGFAAGVGSALALAAVVANVVAVLVSVVVWVGATAAALRVVPG